MWSLRFRLPLAAEWLETEVEVAEKATATEPKPKTTRTVKK